MNRIAEVIVAGTGPAGLAAALALARAGCRVIAVGHIDRRVNSRTVALFDASLRFFAAVGVLEGICARGAPLEVMRIVDDTDSLFRLPQADFSAREIGLDAFGVNIENHELVDVLAGVAGETPGITLVEGTIAECRLDQEAAAVRLDDGRQMKGALLVGADGRDSIVRTAAGIPVTRRQYRQTALTAVLRHERPHHNISTEFHTRGGPFTLVPLPPRQDHPHRSSLVWMMSPDQAQTLAEKSTRTLASSIGRQSHSLLGAVEPEGPASVFPMSLLRASRLVGDRVALVGDAAHGFPPIGAQGLNLGLRDVAHLAQAMERRPDPGCPDALRAYAELRALDVGLRSAAVDLLNRSLLESFLPVDFLRGAGLLALSQIGPVRRAIMREGIAPAVQTPRVMRDRSRGK